MSQEQSQLGDVSLQLTTFVDEQSVQKVFLKRKLEEVKAKHAEKLNSGLNEKFETVSPDHAEQACNTVGNKPIAFTPSSSSRMREPDLEENNMGQPSYATMDASENRTIQGSFTNCNISDLLFVEIFAGTARLSKAAREIGMEALPVDKAAARSTQIHIAQYDVSEPEQLAALMEVLENEKTQDCSGAPSTSLWNCIKGAREETAFLGKERFQDPSTFKIS